MVRVRPLSGATQTVASMSWEEPLNNESSLVPRLGFVVGHFSFLFFLFFFSPFSFFFVFFLFSVAG